MISLRRKGNVSANVALPSKRLLGRKYDRQFFLAVILLQVAAVVILVWRVSCWPA
jgi:hypothetical protein